MNEPFEIILLSWFFVFCRVAACIMTLPGIGGERVPARTKIYVSLAIAAPIAVYLWPELRPALENKSLPRIGVDCAFEIVIGVILGLSARMFLFAIETIFTGVSLSIGLGNSLGAPINESEPSPALASWAILGVTTLMFCLDVHLEFIRGLKTSYALVRPFEFQQSETMLREMMKSLTHAYLTIFRIASPYLIYGLASNAAVAFLNKMTPQVPIYFAATPALILGGIGFIYSMAPEALNEMAIEYTAWLSKG